MWVVGINRPYYPSVDFFNDEDSAIKEYSEMLKEHCKDGQYDVKVFMAEVIHNYDIKTDY